MNAVLAREPEQSRSVEAAVSKAAVLRFALARSGGTSNVATSSVSGSTATMALSPPPPGYSQWSGALLRKAAISGAIWSA